VPTRARIRRAISYPSISGSPMSIKATSGAHSTASRIADAPSAASVVPVVLHHEDTAAHQGWRGRRGWGEGTGDVMGPEPDLELAASTETLAPRGEDAAVELDQPAGRRQADPEAAPGPRQRGVGLGEQVEDLLEHLGGDADSRVAHGVLPVEGWAEALAALAAGEAFDGGGSRRAAA